MDVTLPADLTKQVEQELASGHYRSRDELIEQAVRRFFDERQRGKQQLDALRRIDQAVEQPGLYERALIPSQHCRAHRSFSWTPASSPTALYAIRSCALRNPPRSFSLHG